MIVFDPQKNATLSAESARALAQASGSPASLVAYHAGGLGAASAIGLADIGSGRPATAQDQFEVGSQTKMMTATIILQLVSEGKLDLNDTVSDFLGHSVTKGIAGAEKATVRQLLQMTSGIANYTDVTTKDGDSAMVAELLAHPDKTFGTKESLDLVRGLKPDSAPGSYHYSNTNYVLLGEIIEKLTGQSYAQALQTRIFDKAGLKQTQYEGLVNSPKGLHGYVDLNGQQVDSTAVKWDKGAEGGVVSTMADMARFMGALFMEGKLLSPAMLKEMQTGMVTEHQGPVTVSFGLGLSIVDIKGEGRFLGFTGGTFGFSSSTYISLKTGNVVTAAINKADTGVPIDSGVLTLLESLNHDAGMKTPQNFDPAKDQLEIRSVSAADLHFKDQALFSGAAKGSSLALPLALRDVTTGNVRLTDGSVVVVGDNRLGSKGDDRGNTIDIVAQFSKAAQKDNYLMGLGGNDILKGGYGDDRLEGGRGDDRLYGRSGNDRLDGGAGQDVLTGGKGHDIFLFRSAVDAGTSVKAADRIVDFVTGEDRLDFRPIDADRGSAGNQAFHLSGHDFDGQAGALRVQLFDESGSGRDRTVVSGDVTGDGKADFVIVLDGLHDLTGGDLLL